MAEVPGSVPTATRLMDGRLLVRQATSGHRVGTDAILLAAATTPTAGERVIDVGSGVGSVGLAVALRHPGVAVCLLEIMPELATLARDNIALNGLQDRVTVAAEDLFAKATAGAIGTASWVVSNPPFQSAAAGRPSPDPLRARAHTLMSEEGLGPGDWLRAMLRLAAPHAALVMIHRPDAVPALLAAAAGRLGQVRIMPVYPHAGEPAIRVLFGGIVGSRAPFGIADPLVLHDEDGGFTRHAEALHRGDEMIALLQTRKSRPSRPASSSSFMP